MAKRADLIVAAALIDTLVFADGRAEENIPGGAGLYALAGAALFSEDALLVTGTGADFVESYGPWLDRNGLSRRGLRIADPHTPRNLLRYTDERLRTETPVFGATHFHKIEPTADDVARAIGGARSAYVFRNTEAAFWDGLIALRQAHNFTLLWEIGLDACSPAERPNIERLVAHVDALSLNLEEASRVFRTEREDGLVRLLAGWPVAHVFLRAGNRGSYAIGRGNVRFVPSLQVRPVDVTGGGNAYSGAALVGLAEGRPAVEAAAMGTVAASLAIGQLGLPEPGDDAQQATARLRLAALIDTLRREAVA
jgi:sugar/nucleoside kinase (ribokinase family)